jgi:2-(1,2-epoxy-1,2-dihydrophenyl)acetyl-CoA isomerase
MGESVLYEKNNGIATIFLNEADTANALSPSLKRELLAAFQDSEKDTSVKAIILAGKGNGFCSGGDISTMGTTFTAVQVKQRMDDAAKLIWTIHNIKKPVIAAVHGYAIGAGLVFALAADIIIAEKGTKLGLGFKNIGLIPDIGGHYFLQKAVGPWKVKEWFWTGAKITPEEGERMGFINRLVNHGEAFEKAKALATEIAEGPVLAFGYTKTILNRPLNSLDDILELEGFGQSILFQTKDHQEGVEAFFEKRQPQFTGE